MLHLIKCYDYAEEDDWNNFLLAPLGIVEHFSPDFSVVEDNAIFFMIGTRGLRHVPSGFLDRVRKLKRKALYHLGDEYFAGGYELYRHFDFVIRNHYAAALSAPGIRTVPLGYPKGSAGNAGDHPASRRPLVWAFMGNWSVPRSNMAAHFRSLTPNRLHLVHMTRGPAPISREEYKETLRSSAFVPCPMGNVLLETWRLYEALEAGAIPLVSRRPLMPYHDRVMPGHPIPAFVNWDIARRYVARLLANPQEMDELQGRIGEWWAAYKTNLRADLCDYVLRGFDGAFRSELAQWRPPSGAGFQAWRMVELLKHHDLVALRGRCETTLKRLAQSTGIVGPGGSARPSDANPA